MNKTQKNVLVVDDDPVFRVSMEFELVRAGYNVSTAADGTEAIAHLSKNKIDAVISDILMPKMGGLDLLKEIKKAVPEMPIVMLITGFSDITSEKAQEMGAHALYSKTLGGKAIKNSVIELINATQPHQLTNDNKNLTGISAQLKFPHIREPLSLAVTNIHEKGFAIRLSDAYPQVYDECFYEVKAPKQLDISGAGVVSWVRMLGQPSGLSGCGIEFLDMSENSRKTLSRWMSEF